MMMHRLMFALSFGAVLFGCSSVPPEEMLGTALQEETHAREMADTVVDAAARARLFGPAVTAYEELLEAHPNSAQAQEGMFRLATIYNNDIRDFSKAVAMYRSYAERFPQGEKTAVAMFLIGYVYHNELQMLDSAKVAYERFLNTYPDHEMAISAQFELNTLGKPPEDLVPKEDAQTPTVAQGKGGS